MSPWLLKAGVGATCAYELGAILGCPWPTITALVHSHRSTSKLCRVAVWASLGVAAYHLLVEQPGEAR